MHFGCSGSATLLVSITEVSVFSIPIDQDWGPGVHWSLPSLGFMVVCFAVEGLNIRKEWRFQNEANFVRSIIQESEMKIHL